MRSQGLSYLRVHKRTKRARNHGGRLHAALEERLSPVEPDELIFYAVSELHGHYYPLSVWCEENPSALHAGRQDDSWRGRDLISSCLRTVSIFSNPNNRRAIQNELNMAKSFYQNPEHLL